MSRIYRSADGERQVRERYLAFLKRWPVEQQEIRVPTSQGETFVVACGPESAPALLLLHGGGGNCAMWMGEASTYAHAFRVYCIDMIGEAGLSAGSRPRLASDAHAVWLDDVLRGLSVERTSMLGVSLGGWLALDYATRRPERVECVAVICPGGVGRQRVGIVLQTLMLRAFGKWGKRKLTEKILGRAPADPYLGGTRRIALRKRKWRQRSKLRSSPNSYRLTAILPAGVQARLCTVQRAGGVSR